MHTLLKQKSGFVLVIALVLVGLTTIVMVDLAETTLRTAREIRNIGALKEAYSAARSGLHWARWMNKYYGGPGFQMSCKNDASECIFPKTAVDFRDINGSYADWQIQGRATCLLIDPLDPESCEGSSSTFYIPRPSTGNALKKCDPLRVYPDGDGDGIYDADHPCNWGKIRYGETIAIPLYVTELDRDMEKVIVNPVDDPDRNGTPHIMGITLKMRTPCKDPKVKWCEPSDRYKLDALSHDLNEDEMPDDTVVLWQIAGNNKNEPGKQLYLIPNDQIDESTKPVTRDYLCNSEIYETKINDAYIYDFRVLNGGRGVDCNANGGTIVEAGINQDGDLEVIYDFLIDDPFDDNDSSIDKPVLSLQVIGSLIESYSGGSIPYLEYQLVIDGDSADPPADMYQTLISEGYSPGHEAMFKQSLEMKQGLSTGLTKFVIAN